MYSVDDECNCSLTHDGGHEQHQVDGRQLGDNRRGTLHVGSRRLARVLDGQEQHAENTYLDTQTTTTAARYANYMRNGTEGSKYQCGLLRVPSSRTTWRYDCASESIDADDGGSYPAADWPSSEQPMGASLD